VGEGERVGDDERVDEDAPVQEVDPLAGPMAGAPDAVLVRFG